MNRRQALGLLAGCGAWCALAPALSWAIGTSSKVSLAHLHYASGSWNPREGAARKLMLEVEKRTSILVEPITAAVEPESEELFRYPFIIWSGDRAFDPFSEEAVVNLGVYLRAGGFILIDGCEGVPDGGFDRSVRRELARIMPSTPLQPVPSDHVIFKSFYMLDQPWGRVDASDVLEAIPQDDRLMVVYTPNDVEEAWARDNFGNYLYDVSPGGERQRDLAYRFGVNCVMYALCINYKADQVHVPFILKRRQWKVE